MRRTTAGVTALLVVAALLAATGCTRVRLSDQAATRTYTETPAFPLQGARTLDADIRMGVGEVRLSADASSTDALAGTFTYRPATWKPETSYKLTGETGVLRVAQPGSSTFPMMRSVANTWDLRLGGGVPTALKLTLGVGQSTIDLRGLDLTSLDIRSGVGESTVDLSGPRKNGFRARIESGIGAATLRVPRTVGVRITGTRDGKGDITAEGFRRSDNAIENDAYRGPGPKIEIALQRGVGEVRVELVD